MEINHGEKVIIFMKNIFVCIAKYRSCLLEYIDFRLCIRKIVCTCSFL